MPLPALRCLRGWRRGGEAKNRGSRRWRGSGGRGEQGGSWGGGEAGTPRRERGGWKRGPSHESRERVPAVGTAAPRAPPGPRPLCAGMPCAAVHAMFRPDSSPRSRGRHIDARGGRERRGAGAAFAWAAGGGQELARRGSGRKNRDGGEGRRGGAHLAGRAVRRRRGCRRRLPRADSASMLLFLGLGAYSMPLPWRNSFG